jgi:PPK2 family polyphosphate:nucleotide phosphotransferase
LTTTENASTEPEGNVKHEHRFDRDEFRVRPGKKVRLKDHPTEAGKHLKKADAKKALKQDVAALADAQRLLWAGEKYSLLVILQGLDASGKDSTIRHVMSGVNPQGCSVYSFKAPTDEELRHPFLWRPVRYLPGRGRIAIFNRSYYEEVLVVRVHPEFLERQNLPPLDPGEDIWDVRFEDINAFEHSLFRHGTRVIKFFLHHSRKEQKKRFLKRLDDSEKNWKFSEQDIRERQFWPQYVEAYEEMLRRTSTAWAPWHIVPADDKWFARAVVADVITATIDDLDLSYPVVDEAARARLLEAREQLVAEED